MEKKGDTKRYSKKSVKNIYHPFIWQRVNNHNN